MKETRRPRLLRRVLVYVASTLTSGTIGWVGQRAIETLTGKDWNWPVLATAIGLGVVGALSVWLYDESRERRALAAQVVDLSDTLALRNDMLDVEVQQLHTVVHVHISDADGKVATLTKDVVFVPLREGITCLHETVRFDGTAARPRFLLSKCLDATYNVDEAEATRWEEVRCPKTMDRGHPSFAGDWTVCLEEPLEARTIYRKRLTFTMTDCYTGQREFHNHRFDRERRSELTFTFSAGYGGDLPQRWFDDPSIRPQAWLRPRYGEIRAPTMQPTPLDSGALRLYFRLEPQLGDAFRLEWVNPSGADGGPS